MRLMLGHRNGSTLIEDLESKFVTVAEAKIKLEKWSNDLKADLDEKFKTVIDVNIRENFISEIFHRISDDLEKLGSNKEPSFSKEEISKLVQVLRPKPVSSTIGSFCKYQA